MTHMSGLIVMGIYAMSLPSVSLLLTKNMTYGSSFGSMTQTQFVLWQFVSWSRNTSVYTLANMANDQSIMHK